MSELQPRGLPCWDVASLREAVRPHERSYLEGIEAGRTLASVDAAVWGHHVLVGGEFVAGAWVLPDGPFRGWAAAMFGPMFEERRGQRACRDLGLDFLAWQLSSGFTLRAWVKVGDARACAFAKHMGFVVDCGPAHGLMPCGSDAWLMISEG